MLSTCGAATKEGVALQACLMAHATLIPHTRLPWLPNAPAPESEPHTPHLASSSSPNAARPSLPKPLWEPLALAAAAAAKGGKKDKKSSAKVALPAVDVGQGEMVQVELVCLTRVFERRRMVSNRYKVEFERKVSNVPPFEFNVWPTL